MAKQTAENPWPDSRRRRRVERERPFFWYWDDVSPSPRLLDLLLTQGCVVLCCGVWTPPSLALLIIKHEPGVRRYCRWSDYQAGRGEEFNVRFPASLVVECTRWWLLVSQPAEVVVLSSFKNKMAQ
jgi:hypothetical protein